MPDMILPPPVPIELVPRVPLATSYPARREHAPPERLVPALDRRLVVRVDVPIEVRVSTNVVCASDPAVDDPVIGRVAVAVRVRVAYRHPERHAVGGVLRPLSHRACAGDD